MTKPTSYIPYSSYTTLMRSDGHLAGGLFPIQGSMFNKVYGANAVDIIPIPDGAVFCHIVASASSFRFTVDGSVPAVSGRGITPSTSGSYTFVINPDISLQVAGATGTDVSIQFYGSA